MRYQCPYCGYPFQTQKQLDAHLENEMSKDTPGPIEQIVNLFRESLVCDWCQKQNDHRLCESHKTQLDQIEKSE